MNYTVSATVTCDVVISIEAASHQEALDTFRDMLVMNADLTDVPKEHFDVEDDTIVEINGIAVNEKQLPETST